jgi:MerR family transcriptional regulator, copper efflux regulator
MNIGDVAAQSGLPAKTIRYYEDIGLVKPLRGDNGYRRYRETDAQKLGFLRRARALGFSIEQCRALLALWVDEGRASADVTAIARVHLDEVEAKIADLSAMRDTLAGLIRHCAADGSPNCAILEGLARGG